MVKRKKPILRKKERSESVSQSKSKSIFKKIPKPSKQVSNKLAANPMWGGRFEGRSDDLMEAINASIHIDKALYKEDIHGSRAHAKMLAKQGILPKKDVQEILGGLDQIEHEIETGTFTFTATLEDIHMHVEARLKEIIGEAAGRLHTARSRNDQVATDFRLWIRNHIDEVGVALDKLLYTLVMLAEKNTDTIMPGYTHLQTAQPVTLGHHLLAYAEMFSRDASRFKDARARMNECPLGAAALAGTSFPLDRAMTAKELGFDQPMANSIDAVSDRDFVLEYLSHAAICAVHLSRLAEELVLWVNPDFGFVMLPGSFTTGSSIMPQKRNPDAAELIRAKTGRINGSLITLLTVMKALPLAYSKDMQEDKEPALDTAASLLLSLRAMDAMLSGDFIVNKERMYQAASRGFSTATDIADWLVQNLGLPFRECHHITGSIVKYAESKGKLLEELSLKELQKFEPRIDKGLLSVLSVKNSVKSRKSYGGTSPSQVKEQVKKWKGRWGQ